MLLLYKRLEHLLIKSIELEIQSGCLLKLGAYWRLGAYKILTIFSKW